MIAAVRRGTQVFVDRGRRGACGRRPDGVGGSVAARARRLAQRRPHRLAVHRGADSRGARVRRGDGDDGVRAGESTRSARRRRTRSTNPTVGLLWFHGLEDRSPARARPWGAGRIRLAPQTQCTREGRHVPCCVPPWQPISGRLRQACPGRGGSRSSPGRTMVGRRDRSARAPREYARPRHRR